MASPPIATTPLRHRAGLFRNRIASWARFSAVSRLAFSGGSKRLTGPRNENWIVVLSPEVLTELTRQAKGSDPTDQTPSLLQFRMFARSASALEGDRGSSHRVTSALQSK